LNLETEYAGHGTKMAQELDLAVFDVIVAIGGDGTLLGKLILLERKLIILF
jgi:diacylglycerol kinase family enzyme